MALTVEKVNETFVRIDGDYGDLTTVAEMLTFEIPSARFNPKVQSGMWDGKIRLINRANRLMYVGLVPELVKTAIQLDIGIRVDPSCRPKPIDPQTIIDFIDNLDLPFEPHDFQLTATIEAINRKRLLIISPTSSGKSLIIYLINKFLGVKTLIVCPTILLVNQMKGDFESYGLDEEVHLIAEGSDKNTDKRIVISTVASLLNVTAKYLNQYDCIVADEVHKFSSDKISKIVEKATDVPYRIGLTGSLKESKTHKLTLTGLFGPPIETISTREMIDRGISSDVNIYIIVLKHSTEAQKSLGRLHTYADENDVIMASDQRNEFIRQLVAHLEGNTMVLFRKIEKHGDILKQYLERDEKPVYYIHGKGDDEVRNNIKSIAESTDGINILASAGVFATGTSINNIQNGVLGNTIKSLIDVVQTLGRGLRKDGKTNVFNLFDISDKFSRIGDRRDPNGYSYRHLQARLAIYAEKQLPYKIIEIDLERLGCPKLFDFLSSTPKKS